MRGLRRTVTCALTISIVGFAGIAGASAAGALAVGACGAYGQAYGYRTVSSAQNSALQQCKSAGCRIVATLRKSCAALAVDIGSPCTAHGSAHHSRLGVAQNSALQQCYNGGGKECVIRTFVCDGNTTKG